MLKHTTRANYDELNAIARRWTHEAQAARQMVYSIRQCVDALQAGDWVGEGATAFYAEMHTAVLPALNRLVHALSAAAQTTHQINMLMQQAERDAAAVLHDDTTPGQPSGSSGGRLYSPNKGDGTKPPTPPVTLTSGSPLIGATGITGAQTTTLPNMTGVQAGPLNDAPQPNIAVTFFDSQGNPITPATPTPAATATSQPTGTTVPASPTATSAATATAVPPATPANSVGVQFTTLPVPLTGNTFVNAFGPNQFAKDNWKGNYGGTSGLHGGIDLGVPGGTEVKAGVYGTVVSAAGKPSPIPDANSPGGNVVVQVGDKYVVYGHTGQSADLKPGSKVTPDTVIGSTYHWDESNSYDYDNSHLHLTVLEPLPDNGWRTHNPARLFSPDTVLPAGINDVASGESQMESFIYSGSANYWDHKNDEALGIVWR